MKTTNSLLHNKPYIYLISSQIISSLGDWLDLLALLALVALKWEASPMQMTYLMLCLSLPTIVFGTFAGLLADKYDRKKLMILSDILRAIVVIGIALSTHLWQVYLLLLAKSSFAALFVPAKNGKLKELVSTEQLQKAMSISAMIDNGSKIIGPMISGIIVASFGVYWAFYVNAASFLLSAALLFIGIPKSHYTSIQLTVEQKNTWSVFKQMKAGLVFIKTVPILFSGLLTLSFVLLILQIADTQIMILIREIPNAPVNLAGFSIAAIGAGMFCMSAFLAKKNINSTLHYLAFGAISIGIAFTTIALIIDLPVLLLKNIFPLVFFLAGLAAGAVFIPFNVSVQTNTPSHMIGRVSGTVNSITTFASIIGMISGGILVEILGVRVTFILAGSILSLVGLAVILAKIFLLKNDQTLIENSKNIQRDI